MSKSEMYCHYNNNFGHILHLVSFYYNFKRLRLWSLTKVLANLMKLPMQKANQTYDWESPSCAISCGKFQKMRLQDVSILSKVKVLFVMIVALFVLAKLFKLTVVAQKLRLSPATHSTNVTNLHRAAQFTNIASHAVFSQIIRIHWPNLFWVQLYP